MGEKGRRLARKKGEKGWALMKRGKRGGYNG